MDFCIGDRVVWESQSRGVWKRKIGSVVAVTENNIQVEVDTVVGLDWDSNREIGTRKVLKNPKTYFPRKRFCRLVKT